METYIQIIDRHSGLVGRATKGVDGNSLEELCANFSSGVERLFLNSGVYPNVDELVKYAFIEAVDYDEVKNGTVMNEEYLIGAINAFYQKFGKVFQIERNC